MSSVAISFEWLIRHADDRLILGQRLSEWCGHGPVLEEDIALANIALDLIGQAQALLQYAAEIEGAGRDADSLAFLRDEREFRNLMLVEQPNGDFACTIVRQFLFDSYDLLWCEACSRSSDPRLAGIFAKAALEARYHLRHSSEWLARLGDGTDESHQRCVRALDRLWPYTAEMFGSDAIDQHMTAGLSAVDPPSLQAAWQSQVTAALRRATLPIPSADHYQQRGSRQGLHTEHLGHLLAELQALPRCHPGARW
jgi:ring-1,2-phenylacetyl-CoA epoxidase subunit PaaC